MSARRMATNAALSALLIVGVLLVTGGHPMIGGVALGLFVAAGRP